jgi:glutamine synthetase
VWIEGISIYRIPDAGRFELRLADGAVNPYLLQAAILGMLCIHSCVILTIL